MSRIIGWRTLKGMKKQHYAKLTYNGDACFHCIESTSNTMAVSGCSTNAIEKADLLINKALPKCKKCLNEEKRIEEIESYNTQSSGREARR